MCLFVNNEALFIGCFDLLLIKIRMIIDSSLRDLTCLYWSRKPKGLLTTSLNLNNFTLPNVLVLDKLNNELINIIK